MKRYKYLAALFAVLAILLSNVMCTVIAYDYCALRWCGRYTGCSAPPSAAFVYCIPYGIGIIICAALSWIFYKKHQKLL